MSRVPQVTRTIPTTIASIVCVNLEDRKVFTQEITLPRTYKDEKSLMKAVEKALEGESIKALSVESSEVKETLYGMLESDFIKYATVLPPRGTKEDEADSEN